MNTLEVRSESSKIEIQIDVDGCIAVTEIADGKY